MDPSGLPYAQRVIEHNFEPEASAFQWSINFVQGQRSAVELRAQFIVF